MFICFCFVVFFFFPKQIYRHTKAGTPPPHPALPAPLERRAGAFRRASAVPCTHQAPSSHSRPFPWGTGEGARSPARAQAARGGSRTPRAARLEAGPRGQGSRGGAGSPQHRPLCLSTAPFHSLQPKARSLLHCLCCTRPRQETSEGQGCKTQQQLIAKGSLSLRLYTSFFLSFSLFFFSLCLF